MKKRSVAVLCARNAVSLGVARTLVYILVL